MRYNNPRFKHKGIRKKATDYIEDDESIIFKLYDTEIVKVTPFEIILNTGGWWTLTTKKRMNQISEELDLGYYVSQVKGRWFVTYAGKRYKLDERIVVLPRI